MGSASRGVRTPNLTWHVSQAVCLQTLITICCHNQLLTILLLLFDQVVAVLGVTRNLAKKFRMAEGVALRYPTRQGSTQTAALEMVSCSVVLFSLSEKPDRLRHDNLLQRSKLRACVHADPVVLFLAAVSLHLNRHFPVTWAVKKATLIGNHAGVQSSLSTNCTELIT